MINISGFEGIGEWYTGNLHSHTTISDGILTPEECVSLYRSAGYHFLCLSEHDIYTDFRADFITDDFLILPGIEYSAVLYQDINTPNRHKIHHLHGILGTEEMQRNAPDGIFSHMQHIPPLKYYRQWPGADVAQQMADMLNRHGCVVTYNHPVWSRVEADEFINTQGIVALEIFNYNTVQESNTGYDTIHWDSILRQGKRVYAIASDDNHNEGLFEDSCGGWISVQAPSLTHDNLIKGILSGNYYSSSGPSISDWGIRDGIAYVNCSAVNKIHFIAGNQINDGITLLGEPYKDVLIHGEYVLKGHETYLRCECVDKFGHTAWTNPIFLNT